MRTHQKLFSGGFLQFLLVCLVFREKLPLLLFASFRISFFFLRPSQVLLNLLVQILFATLGGFPGRNNDSERRSAGVLAAERTKRFQPGVGFRG